MARPRKYDQINRGGDELCNEKIVHIDSVRQARAALPDARALTEIANVFSALSDPTRINILAALSARELCVCDLAATISQTESAVSHQLRVLRSLRLVRSRREGRLVFYALDDDHVATLFEQAIDHVGHQAREDQS